MSLSIGTFPVSTSGKGIKRVDALELKFLVFIFCYFASYTVSVYKTRSHVFPSSFGSSVIHGHNAYAQFLFGWFVVM